MRGTPRRRPDAARGGERWCRADLSKADSVTTAGIRAGEGRGDPSPTPLGPPIGGRATHLVTCYSATPGLRAPDPVGGNPTEHAGRREMVDSKCARDPAGYDRSRYGVLGRPHIPEMREHCVLVSLGLADRDSQATSVTDHEALGWRHTVSGRSPAQRLVVCHGSGLAIAVGETERYKDAVLPAYREYAGDRGRRIATCRSRGSSHAFGINHLASPRVFGGVSADGIRRPQASGRRVARHEMGRAPADRRAERVG